MSAKPRQRSEISLSLASVLVISANCAHVVLKGVRQRLRRGLALCAGAVLQQIERRLDGERFARDLEPQIGDGRVELPVPGRISRSPIFRETAARRDLRADRAGSAARLRARAGNDRAPDRPSLLSSIASSIAVEFEREEQQMRRGRRHAAPARRRRIWCAPDRPCCRHERARHRSRAGPSDRRSLHSAAPPRRAPRRRRRAAAIAASLPL